MSSKGSRPGGLGVGYFEPFGATDVLRTRRQVKFLRNATGNSLDAFSPEEKVNVGSM